VECPTSPAGESGEHGAGTIDRASPGADGAGVSGRVGGDDGDHGDIGDVRIGDLKAEVVELSLLGLLGETRPRWLSRNADSREAEPMVPAGSGPTLITGRTRILPILTAPQQ
jgi:hypothetical protein